MSGIALPGGQQQVVVAYPINEVSEMAVKQIAASIFLSLWEREDHSDECAAELARRAAEAAFALNDVCNEVLNERAERIQEQIAKAQAAERLSTK